MAKEFHEKLFHMHIICISEIYSEIRHYRGATAIRNFCLSLIKSEIWYGIEP